MVVVAVHYILPQKKHKHFNYKQRCCINHTLFHYNKINVICVYIVKTQLYLLVVYWVSTTGLSKKMDGIWNRYNLKSTGRIYTFYVLKCSEKFKVLDLP